MSKILKSPARYIQGAGILGELDQYLQGMGSKLMVIISQSGTKRVGPVLEKCFEGKDYTVDYEIFQGECSRRQIDTLLERARELGTTAVIGVGGGKILDTTKAVGYLGGMPVVIVPTVASTDAPCSSLCVIYKENGEFDGYLFLDTCPNTVLVDTSVIAKAPAKLLSAGMGDAMATWFEARACRASGHNNQVKGKPTRAATGLARMCWELLQEYGRQARKDVEQGICSEAVETVVEVNTYLSGVGFESGGLAAAHGIQKGFTFIPQLHALYHGDKVAFCTLTQLVMEKAEEDMHDVLEFCCDVHLPVCFADMGYTEVEPERVRLAAEKACVDGATTHNLPFPVNPEMVYEALMEADRIGSAFRKEYAAR